jgi:hypothetical protein
LLFAGEGLVTMPTGPMPWIRLSEKEWLPINSVGVIEFVIMAPPKKVEKDGGIAIN